jgi:hypothetical protein
MIRSLEILFDNSNDKFSELKVQTSNRAIQENQIQKNGNAFRFGLKWILFCVFWGMLGGASAQFIALDSQKYDEWKRAFGCGVNTINNVNYCQQNKYQKSELNELLFTANHYVFSNDKKDALKSSTTNFKYWPLTKNQIKLFNETKLEFDKGILLYLDSHTQALIYRTFDKNTLGNALRQFNIMDVESARILKVPTNKPNEDYQRIISQTIFNNQYYFLDDRGNKYVFDTAFNFIPQDDTALYNQLFELVQFNTKDTIMFKKTDKRLFLSAGSVFSRALYNWVSMSYLKASGDTFAKDWASFLVIQRNNKFYCKQIIAPDPNFYFFPYRYFKVLNDSIVQVMNFCSFHLHALIPIVTEINFNSGVLTHGGFIDSSSFRKVIASKWFFRNYDMVYMDSNYIAFVDHPLVYNRKTRKMDTLSFADRIYYMLDSRAPKCIEFSRTAMGYEAFYSTGYSLYKVEYDFDLKLINIGVSNVYPFFMLSQPLKSPFVFALDAQYNYCFIPLFR